jgi:predicted Zn-dependent peptidase
VIVIPGPPLHSDEYQAFKVLSYVLDERERQRVPHLVHGDPAERIGVNVNDRFPQRVLLELAGPVPAGTVQLSLRERLGEVRSLSQTLTASEVEMMKRYLRTASRERFSSNHALAMAMLRELANGGHAADVNDWETAIERVDLASCRRVAERWLREAQPSIVIAGTAKELARPLGIHADVRKLSWSRDLRAPSAPGLESP